MIMNSGGALKVMDNAKITNTDELDFLKGWL